MPQVPGNTILGAGGYGSYPGNLYRDRYDWVYSWGLLVGGTALSVTAIGKVGKVGLGLRSQSYRLLRPAEILGGVAHKGAQLYMKQQRWKNAAFILGMLGRDSSSSPGGGGPGLSPISTTPPLSLEATGASLAQSGKSGGPASSSKRRSRPRRKCKPGYRWNGTRCVPKY